MKPDQIVIDKLDGKKLYFASDFHLGAPSHEKSREREAKIVRWLESVRHDAHTIFLMGDIFDFWFEYQHAIPKGFARLQGKLAELTDAGLPVVFFTGNHDMWMFNYFTEEFNIPVYRDLLELHVGNKQLLIGHGDGLGPGDYSYKFLKKIFRNKACQWLFARLHPNTGIGVARFWSRRSRISNGKKEEDTFKGDQEYLLQYCRKVEQEKHYDYYVFGHRHLPLNVKINEHSRYINLGEWVSQYTYATFDGQHMELQTYEE
jgi:UDP-2,3-diacylglucosamine hydrolase